MIMFFKTSLRFFFLVFAYGFEYTFLNFDDFFLFPKLTLNVITKKFSLWIPFWSLYWRQIKKSHFMNTLIIYDRLATRPRWQCHLDDNVIAPTMSSWHRGTTRKCWNNTRRWPTSTRSASAPTAPQSIFDGLKL